MQSPNAAREEHGQSFAGERIRDLLRELGMTQTALAKQCGVSPQYLNNIIRGQQRITQEFATALLNAIGVNLNWLFAGKGPMFLDGGPDADNAANEDASFSELLRAASYNLKRAAEFASRQSR
jgi:addiction module HigA family antidote